MLALWRKPEPPEFQWRLLRYFNAARVFVAVVLLLYAALPGRLFDVPPVPAQGGIALLLALPYLAMALLILCTNLLWRRHFHFRVHFYLALDLVMLGATFLALDRYSDGIAMVLLMPAMAAGALCGLVAALFAAAVASLVVLAEPVGRSLLLLHADAGLLSSGLYGLVYMTAASMMYLLGHRQLVQERLVQSRDHELRLQRLISRLMVHDMRDGVMLIRTSGKVVAANPAALGLLGMPPLLPAKIGGSIALFDLRDIPRLRPVLESMRQWLAVKDEGARILDLVPLVSAGYMEGAGQRRSALPTRLRLRFVVPGLANLQSVYETELTRPSLGVTHMTVGFHESILPRGQGNVTVDGWSVEEERLLREELRDTVLVHIESWQRVTEQAQQEKLASMGRLVAGVAHQIRNPLAAISHASELLSEAGQPVPSLTGGATALVDAQVNARLLRIIHDNVRRLDQVVSDVLALSRRSRTERVSVDLRRSLAEIIERWRHATSARDRGDGNGEEGAVNANVVRLAVDVALPVRFDPEQLQQVVSNLLDNACRYGTGRPGAIRVWAQTLDVATAELVIWNDGPEVPPSQQVHLFEPFYTSDASGTGLGLFMARELCSANDAQVRYGAISLDVLLERTGTWLDVSTDDLPSRAFVLTLAIDHSGGTAAH